MGRTRAVDRDRVRPSPKRNVVTAAPARDAGCITSFIPDHKRLRQIILGRRAGQRDRCVGRIRVGQRDRVAATESMIKIGAACDCRLLG